jgi:hypothetical protein
MKKLISVIFFHLIALHSFAQGEPGKLRRFDIRLNLGSTVTFVPHFSNTILICGKMIIPGFVSPENSVSVNTTVASSTATPLLGWHAHAEIFYKLPRNFSLSVGLGLKRLRFDYTSKFIDINNGQANPADTDELNRDFGKTSLLYLSVTPFNVSKGLLTDNRLSVQAGPVINWLQRHKTNNALLIYYTPQSQENYTPDRAYFDTAGNMREVTWGLNASSSYKIARPLSIRISAQYYFKSIYKDEAPYLGLHATMNKVTPLIIQAGITLEPLAL